MIRCGVGGDCSGGPSRLADWTGFLLEIGSIRPCLETMGLILIRPILLLIMGLFNWAQLMITQPSSIPGGEFAETPESVFVSLSVDPSQSFRLCASIFVGFGLWIAGKALGISQMR